jgi:hypothetical protein
MRVSECFIHDRQDSVNGVGETASRKIRGEIFSVSETPYRPLAITTWVAFSVATYSTHR